MTEVYLETLIPGCANDGGCAVADDVSQAELPEKTVTDVVPSDVPPDSFWLSKDAEFDWFDRHAFYERKDSTRGGAPSNPSPNSTTSQRFTANLKSKASMIGLPKPQQNHLVVDTKHRRISTVTLFPKRTTSLHEPSSPKVSCMGRVRSKKDRKGRSRNRSKTSERTTSKGRVGIFSSIGSLLFSGCKHQRAVAVEESASALGTPARKSMPVGQDIRECIPAEEAVTDGEGRPTADVEPPGLGAMNRFASGRKSESWGQ